MLTSIEHIVVIVDYVQYKNTDIAQNIQMTWKLVIGVAETCTWLILLGDKRMELIYTIHLTAREYQKIHVN